MSQFIGKMCICLSICAVSIVMVSAQVENSTWSLETLTGVAKSHIGTLKNHEKYIVRVEDLWNRVKGCENKLKTLFEDKKKTYQKGDQDLEELNTKLKETVKFHKNEISNLTQHIYEDSNKKDKHISVLQEQVLTLQTELQELNTNYRTLQNNNTNFRDNMMQKDNQIRALQEQMTSLHRELQELNTNYRALQNNNTIFRDKMMQFSQTITDTANNSIEESKKQALKCCGKRKRSELEVSIEVDARPGEVVRVACSVHNVTIATMKWTREQGELPQQATERNGELIIPNARPVDSGLYTCHVTDSTGDTRKATTRVNIAFYGNLPKVRIEPDRQTINQGTSAQLRCIATGDPQPEISWWKVNEELDPQVVTEGGLLQINNAVISDRGMYVCEARNNVGNTRTVAILEVETCQPTEFECSNGLCIPAFRRCDGYRDCPDDGSDENNCPTTSTAAPLCPEKEFQCPNGQCIPNTLVCDGYLDCNDGSDEENKVCGSTTVTCSSSEFTCNSGHCIEGTKRCDQNFDCPDQSDESGCPPSAGECSVSEFTCSDGACIEMRWRCDEVGDCYDGSDEANCKCGRGEFACRDGTCISESVRCDSNYDCFDQSDEQNC